MGIAMGEERLRILINYLAARPITSTLVGLFWLLYLFQIVVLMFSGPRLMASLFYVRFSHLEYIWTWFTAPFGHGSLIHLVFNTVIALWVGSWAESTVTTRTYLCAFVIGGAITAVFGTILSAITPNHLLIDLGLVAGSGESSSAIYGGIGSSMGWFCVFGMLVALRPSSRMIIAGYRPQRWVVFAAWFLISLIGMVVDISIFRFPIGHPFHLVGLIIGGIHGVSLNNWLKDS